jgi:hypothetical protein
MSLESPVSSSSNIHISIARVNNADAPLQYVSYTVAMRQLQKKLERLGLSIYKMMLCILTGL